ELIEAIDAEDGDDILEELGDLLFTVIFLCKMAEKEKKITLPQVVRGVADKLIRRHPHIFGDADVADVDGVVDQWDKIKAEEKKHRKHVLDGIPRGLPVLERAQEVIKRARKIEYTPLKGEDTDLFVTEEELGEELLNIVAKAQSSGFNAAGSLRKVLTHHERRIRS
ncbi:MAG: MazG family protein, partial [Waddliaceae bacterium]|nr:MazG family protein [Waddliaceae bacterium]